MYSVYLFVAHSTDIQCMAYLYKIFPNYLNLIPPVYKCMYFTVDVTGHQRLLYDYKTQCQSNVPNNNNSSKSVYHVVGPYNTG